MLKQNKFLGYDSNENDNFKFAERLSKVENHKLKDNNVLIDFNKTKEITVPGMNNVTIEITSVF